MLTPVEFDPADPIGDPKERKPLDPELDSKVVTQELDVREDRVVQLMRDVMAAPEKYLGMTLTQGTKRVMIRVGPRTGREHMEDRSLQLTITWKDL